MAAKQTRRMPRCQSVGAIVRNRKGEYLVVYRKEKPKGLAFPAGHIESEVDKTPEDALIRELKEETGLRARGLERKLRSAILGCCKRGAKKHFWYVYAVVRHQGKLRRKEPSKHAFVKYMSPKKIREYIECNDVDPSCVEIWKQLNIIIKKKPKVQPRRHK